MVEHEPHLEHWTDRELFKRLLQQAESGRVGLEHFARLPRSLELGVIHARTDQLRQHTNQTGQEAGLAVTYDPVTTKLLIDRQYTEGIAGAAPIDISYSLTTATEERLRSEVTVLQREQVERGVMVLNSFERPADLLFSDEPLAQLLRRYIRRPIGTLHSHPNEVPFSVGDAALFLNKLLTDRISFHALTRPGGITEALILCPETESMDEVTARDNYQRWDSAVDKRMLDIMGTQNTPERAQVFTRINEAMLKTVAKKYKFGWYQSTVERPTVLQRVGLETA